MLLTVERLRAECHTDGANLSIAKRRVGPAKYFTEARDNSIRGNYKDTLSLLRRKGGEGHQTMNRERGMDTGSITIRMD